MSRVATRDPPSAPELTMVLAGSKPAPGSSWAHINAALSELIDANRQMEFKKRQPGGAPTHATVPWRRLDLLGAEGCHLPRFAT